MSEVQLQGTDGKIGDFVALQVSLVRCGGCGAEWEDLDAATHQDGYSEKGCPNRCNRLTTPVYWPGETDDKWRRT